MKKLILIILLASCAKDVPTESNVLILYGKTECKNVTAWRSSGKVYVLSYNGNNSEFIRIDYDTLKKFCVWRFNANAFPVKDTLRTLQIKSTDKAINGLYKSDAGMTFEFKNVQIQL